MAEQFACMQCLQYVNFIYVLHVLLFQVSEFTLADCQTNTSTSLLRSLCHKDDSVILGTRFQDAEEGAIEEQLLANSASGSGAIEHDPCSLFRPPKSSGASTSTATEEEQLSAPGPLPLGVSVVDQSIVVFGIVFPRAAEKHRLQMLEHFAEHIKQHQAKGGGGGVVGAAASAVTAAGGGSSKSAAAEAVQMNIFTAVLSSLKGLVAAKAKFGQDDVKAAAVKLILGKYIKSNPQSQFSAFHRR